MKNKCVFFIFMFICNICFAQNIQFSDAQFKSTLLEDNVADLDGDGDLDGDLDLNDDGEIQVSEAEVVFYLNIASKEISDLSDIHFFKNLQRLNVNNNLLSTIDVSALTQLKKLELEDNLFEELNIENLTFLEEVDFEPNDKLKKVSLKGCEKLVEIDHGVFLDKIDLSNTNEEIVNDIMSSGSIYVDSIIVQNAGLTNKLRLGHSFFGIQYDYLDMRNNNVDSLIFPGFAFSNLSTLYVGGNPMSYVELHDMDSLIQMDLEEISNTLISLSIEDAFNNILELENFPQLEKIETTAEKVTLIDLPKFKHYIKYQGFDQVKDLTLQDMSGLETIFDRSALDKKMTLINLPSLRKVTLENLWYDDLTFNDLPSLDTVVLDDVAVDTVIFANLQSITHINLRGSEIIDEVQISNCGSMVQLFREDVDLVVVRLLRSLKVDNMPVLKKIHIQGTGGSYGGPLQKLYFNQLPVLDSLKIVETGGMDDLQIKDLPNLQNLIYSSDWGTVEQKKLHLSNLPKLTNLRLHKMAIDSLILKDLPKLENLYLRGPRGHVELGDFPLLKKLDLRYIVIDTFRLKNHQNLEYINLKVIGGTENPVILDIDNLPKLHTLESNNAINVPELKFSNLPALTKFKFKKLINSQNEVLKSIYLENVPFLEDLECDYHFNPDSLIKNNVVNHLNLKRASLHSNFGSVFIDNLPSLTNFYFDGHFDDENFYDFSSCPNIESVVTEQWGTSFSDYNFKNGTNSITHFESNGRIRNVCVDDEEEEDYLRTINDELQNTYFTTECPDNVIKTFNTIKGKLVFANAPNLCQFSSVFTGFNRVNVSSASYNAIIYSDQDGLFDFKSDNINEEIILSPIIDDASNYSLFMESDTVLFTDYDNIEDLKFCLNPINPRTDYDVLLVPLNSAVPGFEAEYKLIIRNIGNTALEGTGSISLKYDPSVMTFIDESPFVTMNANDSIRWFFVNLNPFGEKEIDIKFELNSPTDANPLNGGDFLNLSLIVDESLEDENSENNEFKIEQEVVNSFDPNDIRCIEGSLISKDYIGNSIHYMIRFENVGTASAKNIFVTNKIDTTVFDLDSFIPVMASHKMQSEVIGEDTLRFNFDNINLSNNFNNQGYFIYQIKIKDEVTDNVILRNDANIYFDFNAPIYTGLSMTNFKEVTSINKESQIPNIRCYPNPTSDYIQFLSSKPISNKCIYDVYGNLVMSSVIEPRLEGNISLGSYLNGVYILILEDIDGQKNVIRILKK